jgi:hypothetical protein
MTSGGAIPVRTSHMTSCLVISAWSRIGPSWARRSLYPPARRSMHKFSTIAARRSPMLRFGLTNAVELLAVWWAG